MICQLAKKQSNQTKTEVKLSPPFISVDFITNFWGLKLFKLDAETSKNLQVQIELINNKIEEWLKKQTVYVHIYKKVVQNISDDYCLGKWAKSDHSDHKLICSKNVYSNYSKKLFTSKAKNRDRLFKETNRAFNSERSIQKVEIPWIDEYTLKFSDENEAEIDQILYYGYRDSIFYNKNENKWYNEFNQNSSNLEKSCIEESFTNWIP